MYNQFNNAVVLDNYLDNKQCGVNCINFKCRFYDTQFEQNCSAGDDEGDGVILYCNKYIPEHDGA